MMGIGVSLVNQLSAILLLFAILILMGTRKPRWVIFALIIVYIGVFGLVAGVWPIEQAVVKLVAGWMSTAILGATQVRQPDKEMSGGNQRSASMLRVLTGVIVFLLAISVAPDVEAWFPGINFFHGFAGILLGGTGLFLIGFSERPIHLSVALLVLFSGFETIYAVLEDSTLVTALLALLNIAIVLVGSYLHLSGAVQFEEGAA